MNYPVVYDRPINYFDKETLNSFLIWANDLGVSDISIVPNDKIWIRLHGHWYPATEIAISGDELYALVDRISERTDMAASVMAGEPRAFAYTIRQSREHIIRFRCEVTACRSGFNSVALNMVMRAMSLHPPKLEMLNLEPEILKAIKPLYGLVLVTGPVGSGKSTLLAAVMRDIIENEPRSMITYEDPIEFDLFVPNRKGPIVQSEIPSHISHYDRATRNSLRRAADVVYYSESRDRETLRAMSIQAETGIAVYSTVHTNSVEETLSRILREFPQSERDSMAASLISSIRLVVHQRLVPSIKGGRVALRSYLEFTESIRRQLLNLEMHELTGAIREMVMSEGKTLLDDARQKLEDGLINEEYYHKFAAILKSETGE